MGLLSPCHLDFVGPKVHLLTRPLYAWGLTARRTPGGFHASGGLWVIRSGPPPSYRRQYPSGAAVRFWYEGLPHPVKEGNRARIPTEGRGVHQIVMKGELPHVGMGEVLEDGDEADWYVVRGLHHRAVEVQQLVPS